MTQRDLSPPPAIHRAVVQLRCEKCGRETAAACDCCVPYMPVTQRVAEYDEANPGKSTRQAAADLGVSKSAVSEARSSGVHERTPETVTGRDGKDYPATKPRRPSYTPEPGEDDLIDFIVDHFQRLSIQARVRCATRLRNIMQGKE
ncbi:MAG: hypothetical protein WAK67_20095 [Xanthobacteraceae bacterium]